MPLNTIPNKGLTSRGYPSDRLVTPIIINGDMSVAQRGTSFSSMSNGQFITDRFFYDRAGLGITAAFTGSQSTDVPTGTSFANSIKMDVTTAQTLGSSGGTYLGVTTKVEGYNYKLISNQKGTISFWVKSNLTGTYSIVFRNNGNDRVLVEEYTIDSANTWEKKTITLPTFTTGGTWNYTNGLGVSIFFCLAVAGDNDTSTIGSWISSGVTSIYGSSNNVEFASSTDNEWYITGVQLEVGEFDSTTIPSFPFESYESNLLKCYRYYEMISDGRQDSDGIVATAMCYQTNVIALNYQWHPKRGTPSIDQVSGTNFFRFQRNGGTDDFNSIKIYIPNSRTGLIYSDDGLSATFQDNGWVNLNSSSAYVALNAEL